MAQWRIIQDMVRQEKIHERVLQGIYSSRRHFSVLFRDKFAVWIEGQNWDDFDKSESVETFGKEKFDELVQLMKEDLEKQTVVGRLGLGPSVEEFKEFYDGSYKEFVNMMAHLLRTERNLIQSTMECSSEDRHFDVAQENQQLAEELKNFEALLRTSALKLKDLDCKQAEKKMTISDICGQLNMLKKKKGELEPDVEKELQKNLNSISADLMQLRKDTVDTMREVCTKMCELLRAAWQDLKQWKREQRLACTMLCKPKEGIMEVLDSLFEHVATVFHQALYQVDQLLTILKQVNFQTDSPLILAEQCSREMDDLLLKHLKKVFLVDKNIPKQVLKVTNGKSLGFSMSVRLLGGYALGLYANMPKVSVRLYREKQLNDVMVKNETPAPICKIQNSENKPFQFVRNGNCMASFDHMIVSGVKREGKGRNDDFVTDYKYAFVFSTTVKIQDKEIPLKTMSLPIVVTSQTSQECMARGTIIWCSAFRKPKEKRELPFEAEEEVKWADFTEVMNALFKGNTKRPLTEDNLHFLAMKAFKTYDELNFNALCISQKRIFKDKMPGCEFPFWKWFMACLNSVKDHIRCEWKEGLIYGFTSKKKAQEILQNESVGTFLIRFSESLIEQGQRADIHGYLTVAFNEIHPETGQPTVFHTMESLSPKDLVEKTLGPILDAYQIHDAQTGDKKLLRTLWTPEGCHDFEEVFGKYIKEKEKKNDGYRKGRYVVEIFLTENPVRRNSQTPMSPMSMVQSPAALGEVLSPIVSYDFQMPALTPPQVPPPENFQSNPDAPIALVPPLMDGVENSGSFIGGMATNEVQDLMDMLRQNLITTPDGDVMLNQNTVQ